MLVLRRASGQHLIIAGTIRLTILKIKGQQVKLGIEAPPDVVILRGELTPREEDQAASTPKEEQRLPDFVHQTFEV
ncbi:MAG TPA: carbon storage regulator [Ktedonobacteraceae bacterium]|nr:carbon storage regulator [Ktedonobacteraceae bacterium]